MKEKINQYIIKEGLKTTEKIISNPSLFNWLKDISKWYEKRKYEKSFIDYLSDLNIPCNRLLYEIFYYGRGRALLAISTKPDELKNIVIPNSVQWLQCLEVKEEEIQLECYYYWQIPPELFRLLIKWQKYYFKKIKKENKINEKKLKHYYSP